MTNDNPTPQADQDVLTRIAADADLLEIGRKAIEDSLVEMRDARISEMGRGNGLVIREADGKASEIIRFGPETALRIGLTAIAAHLEKAAK